MQSTWDSPDTYIRNVKNYDIFAKRLEQFFIDMSINDLSPLENMKWAVKDPRITLTIPFWERFFPEGKMLFIVRNPIDVAISLQQRHKKDFDFNNCPSYFSFSDLNEGISLWKKYNEFFLFYFPAIEGRYKVIKYEDLIEYPVKHLKEIADFIEYDVSNVNLHEVTKIVDTSKKYSFLKDNSGKASQFLRLPPCCRRFQFARHASKSQPSSA